MQNYQKFIDELFRLTIDTVQYFVVDGQVLYDHLPEHYPTDAPAERLPGHISTFMSLDRYDQHQRENRYADILVELQRQAVTDILLLEPEQVNRLLSDAKSRCERLTQLLKNAIKYQKAWDYSTIDSLSAGFLDLQLLDAFTIKSRPEASPHRRFAHYLTDAIMYKRGTLSGFIKQIENTLQTEPIVLPNPVKEPEYDLWYLNNDDDYAFTKLKELAQYLPTIQPFSERVEWFFKTSQIWEIEPGVMGMGRRMIPDPIQFDHMTEDGKQVDKNGVPVEVVAWGLSYSNDEEKGILHKLYFLRFYRTHYTSYFKKPRYDFDQLQDQYSMQRQNKRGQRLQLEWVIGEIRDRQQIINDSVAANPDRYGNLEIRKQLQKAAVLIEQELEGIPAIRWELLYRITHLNPFALLWGLVEYKRFLETEGVTPSTAETQLYIDEQSHSVVVPYDETQTRQFVRSILTRLSGINPQKQLIMSSADFERLIAYTDHLVLNNSIPAEIQPIAQTSISNEHIRYTFYLLHKQLFATRKKRPAFITFLHRVFAQFSGTAESTTNAKFSTPPKSYEKDFASYIGETA